MAKYLDFGVTMDPKVCELFGEDPWFALPHRMIELEAPLLPKGGGEPSIRLLIKFGTPKAEVLAMFALLEDRIRKRTPDHEMPVAGVVNLRDHKLGR